MNRQRTTSSQLGNHQQNLNGFCKKLGAKKLHSIGVIIQVGFSTREHKFCRHDCKNMTSALFQHFSYSTSAAHVSTSLRYCASRRLQDFLRKNPAKKFTTLSYANSKTVKILLFARNSNPLEAAPIR